MKIANNDDIKRVLKRQEELLGMLMMQACFRALEKDARCHTPIVTYPDPPPKKLTREEFEAGGPYYKFALVPEVEQELQRIETWLKNAIERKERWIEKKDRSGRVRRLLHIKTLGDALKMREADEACAARREAAKKDRDEGNDPEDVQTVLRFDDGAAVKLMTPKALSWEGRHMRHCLGDPVYARRLLLQGVKYYSIRDSHGWPRVTFEVVGRRVTQCRGRANSDPIPAYGGRIDWLAGAMGWYGTALNGERHVADHITLDEMVFRRDVSLSEAMLPLARTLYARGAVRAAGLDRLTTLPWVMHVRGDLILRKCRNLRHMPEWLRVDGDMVLEDCGSVQRLATNVFVGGTLSLRGCPRILIDPGCSFIGRTQQARRRPDDGAPPSWRAAGSRAQPVRRPNA